MQFDVAFTNWELDGRETIAVLVSVIAATVVCVLLITRKPPPPDEPKADRDAIREGPPR